MPYVPSAKTGLKTGDDRAAIQTAVSLLANAIVKMGVKHGYDGAFQGELNFAITRLIQEIPRELMQQQGFKEETRYWLQSGVMGVLLDVILEYKRRVNTAYEATQIVKSGDCYDTPFFTRLVDVVDEFGNFIGHQEVMVKRTSFTLNNENLGQITLKVPAGNLKEK